eukprot:15366976-Ditylum_brightwellii.AAC.1
MRALELLVQTVPHVWKTNNKYGLPTDVVISQDHVNLWPDEGHLLALPGMAVVDEIGAKGRVLDLQDSDSDSCALGDDGDDGGPVLSRLALKATNRLKESSNDANSNEGGSNSSSDGIFSPGETAATYHQENFLPTGDFVSMDTTLYSWSLVFSTIFPPCYIDGKWVILGNYTGWHTTHERSVKKSEWYEWLAWRSDGKPMGHPSFCLILYSHKRRAALQGQDKVALHTDDINTTIIAEEFLNEWDNGVVICDLTHQVVATVDALGEYMSSVYTAQGHESSFEHPHVLCCNYKALKKREKVFNLTEGGKRAFTEYQSSIAAVDDNAGKNSHLLETYLGTNACHPGNAPDD